MARSQYGLPAADKTDRSDPRGKAEKIRETAKKYNIDPEVALRVAKSEGLASFNSGVRRKDGTQEPSYGAFQLYTGGGLGNKFQKDTGLDPSDPKNEDATIDYALKHASQNGWGSWYGAKNTGIGNWDGISGGAAAPKTDVASGYGGVGSDAAASERAARVDTTTPDVPQTTAGPDPGFIDKLKDQKTGAAAGLGEAVSGLGQAVAGTGLNKGFTAPPAAPVPVAMPSPPAQMAPLVNPQMAEQQRQQLAAAMQRLNSGRLA